VVEFGDKDLKPIAHLILNVFRTFRIIRVTEKEIDGKKVYESSNFTLINFYLINMGPTKENRLTLNLLIIQVIKIFKFCILSVL
jgi:hypothetical protein